MDPKAILAFAAVGLASPVLGYAAHLLIHWHKTRQAVRFLEADPLVYEGSTFRKILTADGGQLMGPGCIESLEPGRVLAASSDGAVHVPFDPLEFKSVYPHWVSGPGAKPPGQMPPGREESYS